ncbi:hypothetical protein Zm00014a_000996 [Zea mays]|nr:hypothetical protein Zm00014a_000996 [Zea mays]
MYDMNAKIRQFQQMVSLELSEYNHCELPSTYGEHVKDKSKTVDSEGISEELSDKVSNIEAEVQLLEEEYKKDLLYHDKANVLTVEQYMCLPKAVQQSALQTLVGDAVSRVMAGVQAEDLWSVRSWPKSKQRELLWRLLWKRQSSCRSSANILNIKSCLFLCISSRIFPMLSAKLSLTSNTRAAELEKVHASLAVELQRRYVCPGCGVNNMPGLEEAAN